MTHPYPNQQPAPGVPNVNQPTQPAPTQGLPPQNGEVVQERAVPASGSTVAEPKKKKNWLWWLIPVILIPVLAAIAWFALGDRLAGEDTDDSNSEVVETTSVEEELDPAPAPLDGQDPLVTETLDPLPPVDPGAPQVENPDGMVAPDAPAPEQAPEVVDPVVPGGEEMAPAPAPAPAQ